MKVEPATTDDTDALTQIINDLITDTTATFTTVTKTPAGVNAQILKGRFLVVKNAGEVVGYARYFPFRSGPGYAHVAEYSIALTRDAQGCGTGTMLLNALCDLARSDGIAHLIGAVSSDNAGAIRFHLAQGFQQVGRMPDAGRKWGQSLDLILMQKRL